MIKYSRLPSQIQELLPEAVRYLQSREDVMFAYLFGSLGKGNLFPLSDVDIAVYLVNSAGASEKRFEILGALMDFLKTDEIDLVILNRASLPLRMRILQSKKVIVDHDPFFRHRYESLTMREYFDFSIKERNILERRFSRGR